MSQPGYVEILITDPMGQVLVAGSVVLMTIGVFVMQKLVAIKV